MFLKHPSNNMSASFTVEAALVMATVLWALGFMIQEAYTLYDQVTGSMILEEALENTRYAQDDDDCAAEFAKEGEAIGNPRLWLGEFQIVIEETGSKVMGTASAGGWQSQIELKKHRPERFLRRVQALLETRGKDDGG